MTEEEKARETLLLGLSNSLYKLISDLDLEPDVEVIPEESFDETLDNTIEKLDELISNYRGYQKKPRQLNWQITIISIRISI